MADNSPAPKGFYGDVPQAQNQASYRSRDWQTWPSLKLRLTMLPPKTSTLDIYENFSLYGNLVHIVIFETKQGDRSSTAEIIYEPVPSTEFWSQNVQFDTSQGVYRVHAELTYKQKNNFLIESPVDKDIKYEKKQEVIGDSLDFGILSDPESMMVMAICPQSSGSCPRLVLNLPTKEIEVYFPFTQTSKSGSKTRKFRFRLALDDELNMWHLDNDSLILHLPKPPWYSKQLVEALASSHSAGARMWKIEDTWSRQTDMVTYTPTYQEINTIPVALPKKLNDINIFRWTTFRFRPSGGAENEKVLKQFLNALRDWNVKVRKSGSFTVSLSDPNLEQATWRRINGSYDDNEHITLDQEFSRIQLPFSVRYQLEVCLSHGWLSEYSITTAFLKRLANWDEDYARQALVYVANNRKRIFDPMTIFSDIQYSKPMRPKRLPENCVEIHSATVTATGILFHTPSVEITNRILRKHKSQVHRFLRVRFEDDNYRGQTKLFAPTNSRMITIFTRVKRALTRGIKLGDITYDFLAWGNSQLREHGTYFVAASPGMNADSIRLEMGTFKETVVAKKAARMGQCFSTTRPVRLPSLQRIEEKTTIPDIERNGYNFTDGVGKISELAANLVSHELKIKDKAPCLFQFRLGGCKGVLAVSKDVPGIGIQIRSSQFKFNSLSGELEIIRWAEYWQPYLNRQIITCLSQLGVADAVFKRMQQQTIDALEQAMHDDGAASQALRSNIDPNMMTLSICKLVDAGFRRTQEPFVSAVLHLWRAWSLKYLKQKAKIPVRQGAFVLGCIDETATLRGHTSACPSGDIEAIRQDPEYLEKLPEIFIQITDMHTGERKVIEGICILARNPSLHEGDIRVVRALNVSALNHMCNVVVMPQLGDRDLPSMCSGGDLDGDDYLVIWDKNLIPRVWNEAPFHYTPDKPKVVASEITTTHLIDFFHDYLRFDALGKIAHAHIGAADALEAGIKSEVCHELAGLHSKAVDYPKTGVPAKLERRLERDRWPHFMEKKGKTYKSKKVLGQLYDSVEEIGFSPNYDLSFDERISNACDSPTELLENLQVVKRDYDSSLNRILTQHSIQTEFELWSTFVLDHSKKSQDYKFHEEVGNLSRVLKEQYYEALCEVAGGNDFEHLAPVAVAAYKVTQYQLELAKIEAKAKPEDSSEETAPMPFISFPWLLQETLIEIALRADNAKPRMIVATVESGLVNEQSTDMLLNPEGKGSVELPDISEFNLGSSKFAQHLPDPLMANLATTSELKVTEHKKSNGANIESTPVGTAARDQYAVSTSDAGPDSALKRSQTPPFSYEGAAREDHWPIAQREAALQSEYFHDDLANEYINPDNTSPDVVHTPTQAHYSIKVGTVNGDRERAPEDSATLSAVNEKLYRQPPTPSSHSFSSGTAKLNIPAIPRSSKKAETCFYWKNGKCDYSEHDCKYAHHAAGAAPREKQQITCWFWRTTGGCTHRSKNCKYAHYDTGVTIPPPDYQYGGQVVSTKSASALTRNRSAKRWPVPSPTKRAVEDECDDIDASENSPRGSRGFGRGRVAHAKRTIQAESDDENVACGRPASGTKQVHLERNRPWKPSGEAIHFVPATKRPLSPRSPTNPACDLPKDDVPLGSSGRMNDKLEKAQDPILNGVKYVTEVPIERPLLLPTKATTVLPGANSICTNAPASTPRRDHERPLMVNDVASGPLDGQRICNDEADLGDVPVQLQKTVFDDPLTNGSTIEIDELSD